MKTLGLYHIKFMERGNPRPLWFINMWGAGVSTNPSVGAFNAIEMAEQLIGRVGFPFVRPPLGGAYYDVTPIVVPKSVRVDKNHRIVDIEFEGWNPTPPWTESNDEDDEDQLWRATT